MLVIKLVVSLAVFFIAFSSTADEKGALSKNESYTIQPGKGLGNFTFNMTGKDLIEKVGVDHLKDEVQMVDEGERSVNTTVVYPGEKKSFKVTWADAEKSSVTEFSIERSGTAWRLPASIGPGSSLEDVEKANGRAFKMMGFGWDYSGKVVSFDGGKLGQYKGLNMYINPSVAKYGPELIGDKEFLSTNKILRLSKPVVTDINLQE